MKKYGILLAYPILYIVWCKQVKKSWLENDLIGLHEDYFTPYNNRYNQVTLEQELSELKDYDPNNYMARLLSRIAK